MDALPVRRPPSRVRFFALRLEKRKVVVEDVFNAEKDIPEPGALHERRQRRSVRGDRGGHSLDDVVDVVEASLHDRFTERPEPLDVERDVVVDEKDRLRTPAPRIGDVADDALNREAVEVTAAHRDDRAEAAVEGTAARRLHDIHLAAKHGVAGQHARPAPRRRNRAVLDRCDRAGTGLPVPVSMPVHETVDVREWCARLERPYEVTERRLSFTSHDRIHANRRVRPRLRRETRVVAAHDEERLRPQSTNE